MVSPVSAARAPAIQGASESRLPWCSLQSWPPLVVCTGARNATDPDKRARYAVTSYAAVVPPPLHFTAYRLSAFQTSAAGVGAVVDLGEFGHVQTEISPDPPAQFRH